MDIEIYKKAIAEMVAKGLHCVNRIAVIHTNGIKHVSNTACTAGLRDVQGYPSNQWKGFDEGNKIAILSMIMQGGEQEEHFLPFIDWLVNRSPYADAFISKDAEVIAKDKCLVATPNCPDNIMAGALMAARGTYEKKYIMNGWHHLVQRGVNENLAFILAHWSRHGVAGTVGFSRNTMGHVALESCNIDKDYVKSFVTASPVLVNEPYQDTNTYKNISATWGSVNRECYLAPFFAKISYTKEKTNNVFACALPRNNDKTTSIDKGFNQLAVLAKEIMEDIS